MTDLSLKDLERRLRLADESFVRSYTRHGKKLPKLSPEDAAGVEFFNSIQRELQRERMKAIYSDHNV